MHRSGRIAAVLLIAGLCLAAASPPLRAAEVTAHWGQPSVVVHDETGDPAIARAIGAAIEGWNASGAELRFERAGGLGRGCGEPPRGAVVVCRHDLPGSRAGEARNWIDGDHIVAASVLIDTGRYPYEHLVAIACHELGHVLGLDHRAERSSCLTSVIHSSTPDDQDFRTLRERYAHGKHAPVESPSSGQCGIGLRFGDRCIEILIQE